MAQQWFAKLTERQVGPITSKKLTELVSEGMIKPTTEISLDGNKWVKAQSVKGLTFPSSDDDEAAFANMALEVPKRPTLPFIERREKAYKKVFGPYSNVHHDCCRSSRTSMSTFIRRTAIATLPRWSRVG